MAVATTSIIADVVDQVGGEQIDLITLLPLGADPHNYEPSPQDIARIAEADIIFAHGAGLEEFLTNLIESAGAQDKVKQVSEGITLIQCEGGHDREGKGEETEHEGEGQLQERYGADPHTWTDPNNVKIWTHNIEQALRQLDPENAAAYEANSEKYQAELDALDAWIREQVDQLPAANRKIVTDHTLFCYFSDEYGFEQVGAVIPGYSTAAEPSAQELAALEDTIKDLGVKAIFVGDTVNPELAQRLSEDTGIELVFIYTGSLSEPGGGADSYLDYMRHNVGVFVEALK